MYFDGAAHRDGAGAGVVFITSQKEILPFFFTLKQCCSNNVAEYQTLIFELDMDVDMKQLYLQVFGDSQLVINQLLGSYEVKKPELRPYHDFTQKLIRWLGDVALQHVRRTENKKAHALATLASTLTLPDQTQPSEVLHPTIASWLFDAWGLDIVGPLPKSSGGHLYILAATDYFSKWAEVVALKEVKKENDANFIRRKSSMYHAALMVLLKHSIRLYATYSRKLSPNPNGIGLTKEDNARLRLAELEALDEKRLEAQQNLEFYQARLYRSFNKKVRLRCFQVGDQVVAVRRPIITSHKSGGKFTSKLDGPYVSQEAYSNGAYKFVDADGLRIGLINAKFLKRYYP
ncbi:uncharacterized protein [Solanum lycopersicum]|uniref:uncharacterized protein n=1 Tax=Solanum lycopersicum TaxID=4081 RepID=UPI003749029E